MTPAFYGFHIKSYYDTFISDKTMVNFDDSANYKEAMVDLTLQNGRINLASTSKNH